MARLVLGVFLVAGAATTGDYVWYTYGVRHSMTAGLIHGAVLLAAVGGVLGAAAGHVLKGLPIGALAGLGGAASYYAIVAVTGGRTYGAAIPASWVILWLVLAALDGRWLRAPARRSWTTVALRGSAAAVLGGVAFVLVVNVLWGRPPAGGRNYLVQWLAWAFAWAPGLLALTVGHPSAGAASHATASATSRDRSPGLDVSAFGVGGTDAAASASDARETEGAITNRDLLARIDRGEPVLILDVRSEREFAAGHVPSAVNLPFNQVPLRMNEVPGAPGDELIVYCGHGPRAYMAAVPLRHSGRRRVVFMTGHWSGWQAAGLREEQ